MAQFKLFIKEKNNLIPLTIFDSNQDSVLTFATYDEQFTINNYGQFTLTFNMARYVHIGDQKVENLAAHNIKHGTIIQLVDRYQDVYLGVVTNIAYTFSSDNIVMNFTVNDLFSTELSKRNIGYNLNSDIEAVDYIGAMTLDAWARRIIADCKITWFYTDVDTLTNDIRRFTNEPTYNAVKAFSVSDSNAFDALKSLGEFYGMDLKVNGQSKSFGFVPLKNPLDKGLRLSPLLNMSAFSLSTDSQSMITMMTVKGVEMPNGDYLTLLSSIPPSIFSGFNTTDGENSTFYANMFQDYIESVSTALTETERNFLATVYYVPMLENKLINLDYYMENQFLTEQERNDLYDTVYNKLRIANGKLIYNQSQVQQATTTSNQLWNDFLINSESVHASFEAGLLHYINSDDTAEKSFENFVNNYNSVFPPNEAVPLYNRDAYITQSFNRYNNAYQNFLEAIYNGRAYWNAPVSDIISDTNGEYYVEHIDDITELIAIQCAQIASTLSGYGDRAVSEGKYAGFGLPKTGDAVRALYDYSLGTRQAEYAALKWNTALTNIIINDNIVPDPIVVNGLRENLVANSDLLIDSNSDNIPDGFTYAGATNTTLVGGVATFTPTVQLGRLQQYITYPDNSLIYYFARVKTSSLKVAVGNNYIIGSYHSGNNVYEFLSVVYKNNPATQTIKIISVRDDNISDFVPIEVDYIGAINITDLVSRGILPSGLTDAEYKAILDIGVQSAHNPGHDVNGLYSTTTPTDDSYYAVYDMEHNQNVFIPQYIYDDPTNWYFQIKTGFKKVYYEIDTDFYFTYNNILNAIDSSLPKEWIKGLAGNQLKYAAELADGPIPGYQTALAARDAIWLELYQKYGNVIIENYYEDTTATTAELLLENARTKFQLLGRPEPTYSLSMIDIYNVNNAGLNKVEITDQILLDHKVMEDKPNELQKLLSERLYISAINYNLRSNAEISLTVNPVRYDDMLLKRLVKLL